MYSLKDWDAYGRNLTTKSPAILSEPTTSNKFLYKTCQPAWKISDANNSTGTAYTACNSEGHAYFAESGACKYSFASPELTELFSSDYNEGSANNVVKGIELSYKSK